MKMPWGKYKGISLEFINSGYFKWLIEQGFMLESKNESLLLAVEHEMNLRDADSSHFWKDKVSVK